MKSLIALAATVLFIGALFFVIIQDNLNYIKQIETTEIQLSKQSEQVDNELEQIRFENDNGLVGLRGIYLGEKSNETFINKSMGNYFIRYWINKDKNNRVYEIKSEPFECSIEELNHLIDSLNNKYSIELENFVLPEKPNILFENIRSIYDNDNIYISVWGSYYYGSNDCRISLTFFDRQLYLKHLDWKNRKNN